MNINLVYRKNPTGKGEPIITDEMIRKALADYLDKNPLVIDDEPIREKIIEYLVANPGLVKGEISEEELREAIVQFFEDTGFGEFITTLEADVTAIKEDMQDFVTKEYVDSTIGGLVIPDADVSGDIAEALAEYDESFNLNAQFVRFLEENAYDNYFGDLLEIVPIISENLYNIRDLKESLENLDKNTKSYNLIQRINDAIAAEDETVANLIPILGNVQDNLNDIYEIKNTLGDINTILDSLVDAGGES